MRIIGMCLPSATDTTSFYRGVGPLATMAKKSNILVNHMTQYDWSTLRQMSALFMLRPYTANHIEIFAQAKMNNIPVWVDYDDLLTDMPTSNPSYFTYDKASVRKNIEYLIANADVVTVSTTFLAQKWVHLNPNMVVLPNALDLDMLPYRERNAGKRGNTFYWRGSRTHHKDVWMFTEEILRAAEASPDWKFHFLADNLWFLTDRMKHEQAIVMDGMQIEKYYAHIWSVAAAACIVPLHDCPFNKSKSNIAYLEAIFAGGVAIAPDWEEWRHPGALLYKDAKGFENAMSVVARGEVDVEKMNQEAWAYVCDNFSLDKINTKRRQVFERLIM